MNKHLNPSLPEGKFAPKSDSQLADETRDLVEALVGKMADLRTRNLICNIGMDNGAQSGKVALTMFKVEKIVAEFKAPGQPS